LQVDWHLQGSIFEMHARKDCQPCVTLMSHAFQT
jgi:hypothetical protein